jgi:hypothetical protein
MIVFMFLFCINYYLCVYINITRDRIVLQQYDVMIYCQECGIVTGCKQIVEVVRLSNQAIIKHIKISRYRMRPLSTKLYIFSHIQPDKDVLLHRFCTLFRQSRCLVLSETLRKYMVSNYPTVRGSP